jgi:hypothetical protein
MANEIVLTLARNSRVLKLQVMNANLGMGTDGTIGCATLELADLRRAAHAGEKRRLRWYPLDTGGKLQVVAPHSPRLTGHASLATPHWPRLNRHASLAVPHSPHSPRLTRHASLVTLLLALALASLAIASLALARGAAAHTAPPPFTRPHP